jgi:hypothetical protein
VSILKLRFPSKFVVLEETDAEGVRFSMSQWYPKMVEYDYQGWNTNPYIAREFYGVWGNFDVSLTLDKNYMVAATGVLQNPNYRCRRFRK